MMELILHLLQMNNSNNNQSFNFILTQDAPITNLLRDDYCKSFEDVCQLIAHLNYKRNSNKSKVTCVLDDRYGTCSTKHALLKTIAEEHGRNDIKLVVGIFLMTSTNSPKVAGILQEFNLHGIPEAHCYLMHGNNIYDYTFAKSTLQFEADLMQIIELNAAIDISLKESLQQSFLKRWIAQEHIPYTFEQIWAIREKCICGLSDIA